MDTIVVKHTAGFLSRYPPRLGSSTTDPNVPAMGQRLRLKANFVIPDNWTA
jgi:hypothetical protein